jgi:hypothetical protein
MFDAAKDAGWRWVILLSAMPSKNTEKSQSIQTQTRPYHFTMMGRVHDLDVPYPCDPLFSSGCY